MPSFSFSKFVRYKSPSINPNLKTLSIKFFYSSQKYSTPSIISSVFVLSPSFVLTPSSVLTPFSTLTPPFLLLLITFILTLKACTDLLQCQFIFWTHQLIANIQNILFLKKKRSC